MGNNKRIISVEAALYVFADGKYRKPRTVHSFADLDDRVSLINDWGLDDIDITESVMRIEEEYDVHIPVEQVAELKTVGDVRKLVAGLVSKKNG